MARPKTARLQTAYDLGHEHGRTGSRPAAADDVIGDDAGLQEAYDTGLRDGTDSLDEPTTSKPRHRVRPTSSSSSTPRSGAGRRSPAPKQATSSGSKPRQGKPSSSSGRFSHPLHWGSGARGQVIGRPRLSPPRGVAVRDWTGFGFGLFLYALGSAYISYGPGGPTAWLKAKFLNDTSAAAGLTAGNVPPSPQLRQLLVDPLRPPQVAPPPSTTPPGSLGFLFTQPTSPAKP